MGKGIGLLFEYETQKIVQINSTKVGVINRIIQLLIIGYFICWVMIVKKGYQETDDPISAVTTKVKGIGINNLTDNPAYGFMAWDTADYVVPPQENNAFFVITNAVITPKQSQGKCKESPDVRGARCQNDTLCIKGMKSNVASGTFTGVCLNHSSAYGMCEIRGWCPVENDTLPIKNAPLFPMVRKYTVLIKNDIEFLKFKVKRRNVLDWSGKKFLDSCRFEPNHQVNKYCPIITLGTIFQQINASDNLLTEGGVVGINIHWNCNLDWALKFCNPEYSFRRLDDERAITARGLNFRFGHYYRLNNTLHRDLIKAYGVRFLVMVTGQAGKFNVIPLTLNIGSGIALLGLASVVCDIIVLHLLRSKNVYQKAKYETVAQDNKLENEMSRDKSDVSKSFVSPDNNTDHQELVL